MIAIKTDGNEKIGMGHFIRCISIAKELVKQKESVCFLISEFSDKNTLIDNNMPYFILKEEDVPHSVQIGQWMLKNKCYTILVDTYEITPQDFDTLSQVGRVIYIDDLYRFDYNCCCIINYNIEAHYKYYSNSRYNRKLFLGPDYFPLRDEFCKTNNRDISKNVSKVLITTGSTDNYNVAYNILNTLAGKYKYIEFQVLLGLFYKENYKAKLFEIKEIYRNIDLIPWGQNMSAFLTQFDLVLGPGSTIIFEALSMNVPCISFEFVKNHHDQCVSMDDRNMVPFLGNICTFDLKMKNKILQMFKEEIKYDRRKIREEVYSGYFDKRGTQRIVNIIKGENCCIL